MNMDAHIAEIGILVAEQAQEIFEECGCPDDFCIQTVGGQAVFGGHNRVIFHPETGWSCDEGYCTPDFVARFRARNAR